MHLLLIQFELQPENHFSGNFIVVWVLPCTYSRTERVNCAHLVRCALTIELLCAANESLCAFVCDSGMILIGVNREREREAEGERKVEIIRTVHR